MAAHEQAGKCLEGMRTMINNETYSRYEREKNATKIIEDQIIYQQASFLGKRFMYWLFPVVGLYGAGFMVLWVIRGFKNDRR